MRVLEDDDELTRALAGAKGIADQLMAFRAAWRHGRMYMKTLRQSALGCHSLCKDAESRIELESLCNAFTDVDGWYSRYEQDLADLEAMAVVGDQRVLN